jgi:hypothetical protein
MIMDFWPITASVEYSSFPGAPLYDSPSCDESGIEKTGFYTSLRIRQIAVEKFAALW